MKLIDKYELKWEYKTDAEVQKDANTVMDCNNLIKIREYKEKLFWHKI